MLVEVEVVLLDVLAVVALVAGEAEEPLLQDRVAAVPQRQREADALVAVADAGQAVLVPAVGARGGVVGILGGPAPALIFPPPPPLPLATRGPGAQEVWVGWGRVLWLLFFFFVIGWVGLGVGGWGESFLEKGGGVFWGGGGPRAGGGPRPTDLGRCGKWGGAMGVSRGGPGGGGGAPAGSSRSNADPAALITRLSEHPANREPPNREPPR